MNMHVKCLSVSGMKSWRVKEKKWRAKKWTKTEKNHSNLKKRKEKWANYDKNKINSKIFSGE